MPGFKNAGYTNGTPLVILIPNVDRHWEHIEQYQVTNRTPRPGHASYASFVKYGIWDDAIGAGFFSGRYTSTIVAVGAVAKKVLKQHGIEVFAYVKEAGGVRATDVPLEVAKEKVETFRKVRKEYDPIYNWIFKEGRITPQMRFLHKMAVIAELEQKLLDIRAQVPAVDFQKIKEEYGIHFTMNCPDVESAFEMEKRILQRRYFSSMYKYLGINIFIFGFYDTSTVITNNQLNLQYRVYKIEIICMIHYPFSGG